MTSKQRAYLKGLAMKLDPVIQIGKASITPELTKAVDEALEARELIKLHVLKNCFDDPRGIAEVIAERTRSQVVQVIGKKSSFTGSRRIIRYYPRIKGQHPLKEIKRGIQIVFP